MNKFVLIGAAGYIAARHFEAIKNNKCDLVAVCDPFDSIGQLDKYFPDCKFFKKISELEKFIKKYNYKNRHKINYLSICTPNYLHKKNIIFGLKNDLNVICEKPLVLKYQDIVNIKRYQDKTNRKVSTILQLRLLPEMKKLKHTINKTIKKKVKLTYISSRGDWFFKSWKGNNRLSGGIATNIGIHFFDLLIWLFGKVNKIQVKKFDPYSVSGSLSLEKAKVDWFVSVNSLDLPYTYRKNNINTYRSLKLDNKEIEFSKNFTNLHDLSYKRILQGKGFGIDEASSSVQLCEKIRLSIYNE